MKNPPYPMAGLPIEARLSGMNVEEVLKALTSDTLSAELSAEQRQMLLALLQTL